MKPSISLQAYRRFKRFLDGCDWKLFWITITAGVLSLILVAEGTSLFIGLTPVYNYYKFLKESDSYSQCRRCHYYFPNKELIDPGGYNWICEECQSKD